VVELVAAAARESQRSTTQVNPSRRFDERTRLGDYKTVYNDFPRHDPAHGGLTIIEESQLEQKLVESHSTTFHCRSPAMRPSELNRAPQVRQFIVVGYRCIKALVQRSQLLMSPPAQGDIPTIFLSAARH
jgi:hypothetical protein